MREMVSQELLVKSFAVLTRLLLPVRGKQATDQGEQR